MKKIAYIIASAVTLLATTGCSDSYNAQDAAGEGRIILRATVDSDIRLSRAVSQEEQTRLDESCKIWISSDKGLVRQYKGISAVPAEGIWLVGGAYIAEAWAGDSVPASFDARYFKGRETFAVSQGSVAQVNLVCKIANTAVSVKYDEAIDEVLSDYKLTVGHSCGKLEWNGRDDRRGYFMMNSRDHDLTYTITGNRQDGSAFSYEGRIEGARPSTEYVLNVRYNGTEVETGGAFFTVEIDERTVDVEETVMIIPAPTIRRIDDRPLDEPVYCEAGKITRQSIYVAAATRLKSVYLTFPESMKTILGQDGVDMVRAEQSVLSGLESKGLTGLRKTDEVNDLDNIKISFEPELLDQLGDGINAIKVEASVEVEQSDADGLAYTVEKSSTATLTIVITDADVQTEPIPVNDPSVWATEATLTGKVMKDGVESVGFRYREKGTAYWTDVVGIVAQAAIEKGSVYNAVLSGLKPGTTYEYVATAGAFTANSVYEFTTEPADQLPNSGFEDWYMDGKIQRISASSADMFWDSGNKGSATVNTNLTTPCEDLRHSGNYSAKLASQKVAIAFAAGNLFVGEFLGTESLTKGILGWGRPWTTRPRALRGYIKYTPAAISDVNGAPAGVTVNVGDQDTGIIYIGIVDGSTMSYGKYSGWPQIVATKNINSYGFKSSNSNVIAYGEKIITEATAGDGMVEFEIPIEYFRTDVKAANIIVVASASRYGDYYTGGPSVMWLDDLELVY